MTEQLDERRYHAEQVKAVQREEAINSIIDDINADPGLMEEIFIKSITEIVAVHGMADRTKTTALVFDYLSILIKAEAEAIYANDNEEEAINSIIDDLNNDVRRGL